MATTAWRKTRVVKKYDPTQSGARKLALRYGVHLVCVRHRHSDDGRTRYTTVELVVDHAPLPDRPPPHQRVALRIAHSDAALRRKLIAHGATWCPTLSAWWTTRQIASTLRLLRRVVACEPF